MNSDTGHKIKARTDGNDVFITPRKLAQMHIAMIEDAGYTDDCCKWLDPCKNNGSYYDQFPEGQPKVWCEILDGKDFYDYKQSPHKSCHDGRDARAQTGVIIGNPPYSILDDWLKHTCEINPDCFSYLIGQGALTTRRMEMIEKAGYSITRLHLTKVFKWYGMSYIVVCEKMWPGRTAADYPTQLTYDRTVWR